MVLPHPGMVASPEWVTCILLASLSQAARLPEALMTCSLVLFGSVPWCGSGLAAEEHACAFGLHVISARSGKQKLSPGLQDNGLGLFTRSYSAACSTFRHQLY